MNTYNRTRYVAEALESIFSQTYQNFEIILTRDGGTPIDEVVKKFDDDRLIFINRDENRGIPYSFNRAMERASGKYVCYLGDDDKFYPNHIETLLNAIEGQDRYGLVYTDLYKAHCRIEPDGSRTVLAKNVEISRDFDRIVLLHFNHTLHVSLMHRRDLMDKSGLNNENLNILIDWDLTRRLCFYTDFKHIPVITGEFYAPIGDCDRVSVQKRKNINDYVRNLLTIRSTRPPKPWPKVKDLSVILTAERADEELMNKLRNIWSHSFYPHKIYLPMPQEEFGKIKTVVPNIVGVPVEPGASFERKVDVALDCCQGELVAVSTKNYPIYNDEPMWIEKPVNALLNESEEQFAYENVENGPGVFSAVFRREQLDRARPALKHCGFIEAVQQAGVVFKKPRMEQYPFYFDHLLCTARELEDNGDWLKAVQFHEMMCRDYGNELWMKTRGANALYNGGQYDTARQLIGEVNLTRQTVATLMIEARTRKKMKDFAGAIECYRRAEDIICNGYEAYSRGKCQLNSSAI
jgi:glycosyltransferase involved in cell wall biosynthesis